MIGTGGYGLAKLITTSGGYTGLQDASYWLSTECDKDKAWCFSIGQNVGFVTASKSNPSHVRSCLAF